MSQGSWSPVEKTDIRTDTLQYNMSREIIKVQTKRCRSPEKGMSNFDWEGR